MSFKEFGLQDANTLEATQTMLESRAVDLFPLGDQEVLLPAPPQRDGQAGSTTTRGTTVGV